MCVFTVSRRSVSAHAGVCRPCTDRIGMSGLRREGVGGGNRRGYGGLFCIGVTASMRPERRCRWAVVCGLGRAAVDLRAYRSTGHHERVGSLDGVDDAAFRWGGGVVGEVVTRGGPWSAMLKRARISRAPKRKTKETGCARHGQLESSDLAPSSSNGLGKATRQSRAKPAARVCRVQIAA